jgi:hypothetical protein
MTATASAMPAVPGTDARCGGVDADDLALADLGDAHVKAPKGRRIPVHGPVHFSVG